MTKACHLTGNLLASTLLFLIQKYYSKSFKLEVIQIYQGNEGSYSELCVHYSFPSFDADRKSESQYNKDSTIRGFETRKASLMTKERKSIIPSMTII